MNLFVFRATIPCIIKKSVYLDIVQQGTLAILDLAVVGASVMASTLIPCSTPENAPVNKLLLLAIVYYMFFVNKNRFLIMTTCALQASTH